MLYQTACSTQITVGPKSVLTLYCVPNVLFLTSICSYISVQGKWLVLSCPLFGGFTGLEGIGANFSRIATGTITTHPRNFDHVPTILIIITVGKKCYTTSDGLSWPFRHQRCSFLACQKILKVYS